MFQCWCCEQARNQLGTPVTSLGHQDGRRVFREGPKFFELCPIVLNYVQHIFPRGAKNFLGGFAPLYPPGYGPGCVRYAMAAWGAVRCFKGEAKKWCKVLVCSAILIRNLLGNHPSKTRRNVPHVKMLKTQVKLFPQHQVKICCTFISTLVKMGSRVW